MKGGLFLFFVVEASSTSQSDYKYIQSVILHFYIDRKHHREPIYMATKSNLTDLAKINSATKRAMEVGGEVHVILCADKDVNKDEENAKIIRFCKDNSFDLVWMNQNIEHVFLDNPHLRSEDKSSKANDFLRRSDKIFKDFDIALLNTEDPLRKPRSSNLMLVLDKYIERKRR